MMPTPEEVYSALDRKGDHNGTLAAFSAAVVTALLSYLPLRKGKLEDFQEFVGHIVGATKSNVVHLLSTITLIERYFEMKNRFDEGSHNIHHRIFLAALLVSFKYINERSVLNSAWEMICDDYYTLEEINTIEREFLQILAYDVVVEDYITQESWLKTISQVLETQESTKVSFTSFTNSPTDSAVGSIERRPAPKRFSFISLWKSSSKVLPRSVDIKTNSLLPKSSTTSKEKFLNRE